MNLGGVVDEQEIGLIFFIGRQEFFPFPRNRKSEFGI